MFRSTLIACCLAPSISLAQPPFDPSNTESVLLESYIHYFMVKEIFQECAKVIPDQSQTFSTAFEVWKERNKSQLAIVNEAFSKHFASRQSEAKELADAAPAVAHQQYTSSPYDSAVCTGVLLMNNTTRNMDYDIRLNEHLDILRKSLGDS